MTDTQATTQRSSGRGRSLRRAVIPALLLALAGAASAIFYWPPQLYAYTLGRLSSPAPSASVGDIGLPDYRVVVEAKPVAGIRGDLSGITYDYDLDRLLAVTNAGPPELFVLSKTGEVLERHRLRGFEDVEGLAYMGDGRLLLSEERAQRLRLVRLPAPGNGEAIDAGDSPFIALGINLQERNQGFEGVAYDRLHDRLFVVKEAGPRQLFELDGAGRSFDGFLQLSVRDLTAWIERSVFAKDLSDVVHDPRTGHLLLLSDESKLLVELDGNGNFVSFRSLRRYLSELQESAPQAEGVTLDGGGNLYVVSEPNLFYAFQKKAAPSPLSEVGSKAAPLHVSGRTSANALFRPGGAGRADEGPVLYSPAFHRAISP